MGRSRIQDDLRRTRILRKNHEIHEEEDVLSFFSEIGKAFGDRDLRIEVVYSSKVMPEVRSSSRTTSLIWDMHLVDILSQINEVLVLIANTQHTHEDNKELALDKEYRSRVRSIMLGFLAWKLEMYGSYSLTFARESRRCMSSNETTRIDPDDSSRAFLNWMLFKQKLLIFLHEMHHFRFTAIPHELDNQSKKLIGSFGIIREALKDKVASGRSEDDALEVGVVTLMRDTGFLDQRSLESISQLESGQYPALAEEILCDWFACFDVWAATQPAIRPDDKETALKVLSDLLYAFHIVNNCMVNMRNLLSFWKTIINRMESEEILDLGEAVAGVYNACQDDLHEDLLRHQFAASWPIFQIVLRDYGTVPGFVEKYLNRIEGYEYVDNLFADYVLAESAKLMQPDFAVRIAGEATSVEMEDCLSSKDIAETRNQLLGWDTE